MSSDESFFNIFHTGSQTLASPCLSSSSQNTVDDEKELSASRGMCPSKGLTGGGGVNGPCPYQEQAFNFVRKQRVNLRRLKYSQLTIAIDSDQILPLSLLFVRPVFRV